MGRCIWVLVFALAWGAAGGARAELRLERLGRFDDPLYVTHAGDARLFVVEQGGTIRVLEPGVPGEPAVFLDIDAKVRSGGERGLLGLAFHPDHASNGFFYVNYTDAEGATVIERYRVDPETGVADPESAATLLRIEQPFGNHNGGGLATGPDGHLYIGMGDGGAGGDPRCYAQRGDGLLGKMLRLDVRQNASESPYYGIPPDNPFVGDASMRDEVWALGLRNPWRFSFDRETGDLYIGDVGQNAWEEIDRAPAGQGGLNFGWKPMEGSHCYGTRACPEQTPVCNAAELTLPIHEYANGGRRGECSVTGGYVYRGERAPELVGQYVFGDYCSGRIRALRETAEGEFRETLLFDSEDTVRSFGEGVRGNLYVVLGDEVFEIASQPKASSAE